MRKRLIASIALLFAPNISMAQVPVPFALLNERVAGEDRTRFLSTFAGSCDFSIRVLSDDGRARQRVATLEVALRSALGNRLDGHIIRVRSYQIYFNNGAKQRDVVSAVVAGSAGGTSLGKRTLAPLCSKEKTPDGWFDPSELTNANPPFISEIEAVLDDRPLSVRSVYSPKIALTVPPTAFSSNAKKNFADAKAGPEVEAAMDKANRAFVEQVAALLR